MAQLDRTTITKRSVRGFLVLTSIQLVNSSLFFLLTMFVDPRTLGVYIIVSAALSFLVYFSDIGLAAALIQKKEKLTRDDLVTTFTIQQVLVVTVIAVSFFLLPQIGRFYDLDKPGIALFQALLVSFFLSSLKTIPSVNLERNLNFQKLAIPQLAEALVFNAVAVVLSVKGLGIASFTYAVLARGIVGLLLIYIIAPWRPAIGVSLTSTKKLLSFGIPFQANSFLALLKDDLLIIILGKVLTLTEVGFIGFAQKWAFLPLRLVMDKIIRVTFPVFSRLQEDKKMLSFAIEKTLFTLSLLIAPSILGLMVIAPYVVRVVPAYHKWEPALFSLGFFAGNALFSSISTPLTNVLNAMGKIRITLRLMLFWTATTWVLTFTLIRFFGFAGVAISSFLIAISVVLVVYLAKRFIAFSVIKPIAKPVISSIVMAVILYATTPLFVNNIVTLIGAIVAGALLYFASMFILARKEIVSYLTSVLQNLRQ